MRRKLLGVAAALVTLGAVATIAARESGSDATSGFDALAAQAAVVGPASALEAPAGAILAAPGTNADGAAASYSVGGSSETSVMLTDVQRSAIRQRFALLGPSSIARPALRDLTIGEKLPREKVRISQIPSEIVAIVPKYGAYEYFATESGALIIVDPRGYEIVDII